VAALGLEVLARQCVLWWASAGSPLLVFRLWACRLGWCALGLGRSCLRHPFGGLVLFWCAVSVVC
jgi:hypothetical protein